MMLHKTISKFNLFQIKSIDSWMCFFEVLQINICEMLQQETEKSTFRVNFQIGFDFITTMILQNTIKFFQIQLVSNWKFE